MRTTVTIEDDVAAALARIAKQEGISPKQTINAALRDYLMRRGQKKPRGPAFRTATVNLGACLIGSVDDVGEALSHGEGDNFK